MLQSVKVFFTDMYVWGKSIITIPNLIEIIILSICIYYIILWFKKTKAWALMKGIILILVVMLLANIMELKVISAILQSCFNVGIIAFIVLFQPEIRKALEQLGQKRPVQNMFSLEEKELRISDRSIDEIVDACFDMGAVKTGALIVFQKENSLAEWEKSGIKLDACITSQLLVQVFEHNTPLHDGALTIWNDRLQYATCILPVSPNLSINKALGTRHRAGIGISEVTDCLTVIVSEETGMVSIAEGGELLRNVDRVTLREKLIVVQNKPEKIEKKHFWKGWQKKDEKE